MQKNYLLHAFLAVCFVFLSCNNGFAIDDFDFSELEDSIVEKTLDNGLKIIILPKHDAPVVSLVTWANVGGVDDPKEYTGMAHMLEHMAFKGTTTIGSHNLEKEIELMKREDEIFEKLRSERLKGINRDENRIAQLEEKMEKAIEAAYELMIPNEFSNILQREGGTGLNAFTSSDQTAYIISLPSNKLELWMAMESERFLNPLFREMYREREVVVEERLMIVEARPVSKLIEEFLSVAFKAHPYRVPILGHMSDIRNYCRRSVEEYFEKYYAPGNLTISIVGDVEPDTAIKLAKKYWGRIPEGPVPERIATVEPPQNAEKRVYLQERAQPVLIMGWHVPETTHPDTPALKAMKDILGQGRTSRLYRRMVRQERNAVSVSAFTGFPGTKYPSLSVVFAYPAQGHTTEECEKIILEEIEKLQKEQLSENELEQVKARALASFIRGLRNNMGMAQQLARYQQLWGDYGELFREIERINAVTPKDVQRVANKYFVRNNRTVAVLENIDQPQINEKDQNGDEQ